MATRKDMTATITVAGKLSPSVQAAMAGASASCRKLGNAFRRVERVAAAAAAGITLAAGAVAFKLGKECVEAATKFEKQMSNVATLLDGDVKKRIGELNEEVYALSKKTGASTDDLTDGLYNVISALGDSADSMKILETATKAAVAGGATTTDAINLLTAEMKGYNDTSGEFAQRCADMAFTVVKLGQTTFPDLAANMGRCIPLANTMGMKIEEVNGYFATLTGVTGGAAEVSTQLQAALTAMLKPSKEMSKALKKLGYSNGVAAIKAEGLQSILMKLRKNSKNALQFGQLFGRKEGINFALTVTGVQADTAARKIAAMYETAGAADRAFEVSEDNLASRLHRIGNLFDVAKIQIGQELLPVLNDLFKAGEPYLATAVENVIGKSKELAQRARAAIAAFDWQGAAATCREYIDRLAELWRKVVDNRDAIIDFAKGVARAYASIKILQGTVFVFNLLRTAIVGCRNAVVAMYGWTKGLAALTATYTGLSAAFKALRASTIGAAVAQWALNAAMWANPVGLVIAAVVALIAVVVALWYYWDDVCAWCATAWDAVCDAWDAALVGLKAAWDLVQAAFFIGVAAVCKAIEEGVKWWNDFKNALSIALAYLETEFPETFAAVHAAIDGVRVAWDVAVAVLGGYATALKNDFLTAWEEIKIGVSVVLDALLEKVRPIVDNVKQMCLMASTLKDVARGMASKAVDSAKGALRTVGFAKGGFTQGLSLCGENGTEAVISFDPKYRRENQGYLMTAAQMLGMTAAPQTTNNSTQFNLGGLHFAPVIQVGDGAEGADIVEKLRAQMPEIVDALMEEMQERKAMQYA